MTCSMEGDEVEQELMLVEMCNEGSVFKLISSLDHVEREMEGENFENYVKKKLPLTKIRVTRNP